MGRLVHGLTDLAVSNHHWMTWNLLLAWVPVAIAAVLFMRPLHRRHGAAWWCGLGAMVLFLPNAPYVVTDLVHLRDDVISAPTDGTVLIGVLPLYVAFVAAGFLAYVIVVDLLRGELRRRRPDLDGRWFEPAMHVVCSLGIVLGRIARLNSWDVATAPVGSLERTLATLTWRGAPVAFCCILLAVTATYAVVSTLTHSFLLSVQRRLNSNAA